MGATGKTAAARVGPQCAAGASEEPSRATLAAVHAVTTSGLTKHYADRRLPLRLPFVSPAPPVRALEGLDITVREGEIFGFLGPNGAGKSTMIRLLLGYLHPTAGTGRLLGLDIVRDSVAIRRRVGYLPGGI